MARIMAKDSSPLHWLALENLKKILKSQKFTMYFNRFYSLIKIFSLSRNFSFLQRAHSKRKKRKKRGRIKKDIL